ncbi:MAG TPA: hypothetical protein VIQ31_35605, partial [Phormidium sp.]
MMIRFSLTSKMFLVVAVWSFTLNALSPGFLKFLLVQNVWNLAVDATKTAGKVSQNKLQEINKPKSDECKTIYCRLAEQEQK